MNSHPVSHKELPDTVATEGVVHVSTRGPRKYPIGHYPEAEPDTDAISAKLPSLEEGGNEPAPEPKAQHKPHPTLRLDRGDFQPGDAEWQSEVEQGIQNERGHVNMDGEKEAEKRYMASAKAKNQSFPGIYTRDVTTHQSSVENSALESKIAKEHVKNKQHNGAGKQENLEAGFKYVEGQNEEKYDDDLSVPFNMEAHVDPGAEHIPPERNVNQPEAAPQTQGQRTSLQQDAMFVNVEATLVTEDQEAIQVAKYESRSFFGKLVRNKWFWLSSFLLVALIAGLVVGLTVSGGSDGPYSNTTALLLNHSFGNGSELDDTSSPQYQAMVWLEKNANLNSYSDKQKLQRYALATFFFSTNGAGWRNNTGWLTDEHECEWTNFDYLCSDGVNVSNIHLDSNNLLGYLPSELALLSNSLAGITAFNNSLSGTIPTEIGFLSALTKFVMHENDLSKTIPSEIGDLRNLHVLLLDKNELEGTIPTEIGLIRGLDEVKLNFNKLQGTIPSEIGQFTNLAAFWVAHNTIVGSVPTEVGKMTALERFVGLNNNLEGLIPTEFGLLKKLWAFTCRSNQFRGPVPSEFGSLLDMRLLSIHSNELTGTIPTEIYQLTLLKRLEFYGNNMEPPFTCADSIETCLISCDDKKNESCRVFV